MILSYSLTYTYRPTTYFCIESIDQHRLLSPQLNYFRIRSCHQHWQRPSVERGSTLIDQASERLLLSSTFYIIHLLVCM